MTKTTIRGRKGTAFFVVLLLMVVGVVLARSQTKQESKLAGALTFGEITRVVPFEQAASSSAPWFRVTFDWTPTEEMVPAALADTVLAPNAKEKVPETVRNLRRAD